MKTRLLTLLLCLICLTACQNNTAVEVSVTPAPTVTSTPTPTEIPTPTPIEFPYFSTADVLRDLDHMFAVMDKNYPHFSTLKRVYGIDRDEVYERYVEKIKDMGESIRIDEVLWLYSYALYEFNYLGHLFMHSASWHQSMLESYAIMDERYDERGVARGNAALTTPVSVKAYAWLTENMSEDEQADVENDASVTTEKNLTFELLNDDTAYMKIESFFIANPERDRDVIFDFYRQIADYDNLIIDLQDNSGGYQLYWEENVISPNITKPLTHSSYSLLKTSTHKWAKVGEYNKYSSDYKTVSELPEMTDEILAEFDAVYRNDITIEPLSDTKMFGGNIYFLVGGGTHSASDTLASFAKATGFATIVGTNTGGDGSGVLRIEMFTLPRTGLIFQCSTFYPLTPDGSSNTAYGTAPDYYQQEGETALEACLRIIAEQ